MEEHRDLWWESPTLELGKVVHLDLPDGFTAVHGGRLDRVQVAYESWGELNAARDNVVLIVHMLTVDPHATGDWAGQALGWWEGLVGPGRAIDTDRWFVVCPNVLGSCYGTTGPRFPAPDGKPWLERFPLLTPLDLMRVQRHFLRALGVERVRRVIGPSMGGMVAWEWAIEGEDAVEEVVVVAAPLRTTSHQIGLNWLQRRGTELDLQGNEATAAWGQMMARGVGMISYRTPVSLEEKFGREWFTPPGSTLGERGVFNVESWLRHQGRKMVKRYDPWTYILLSRAMDLHDVSAGRGSIVTALERVRCRTTVVGISSDDLYPPAEVHLGADVLNHLGKRVEYAEIRSPHGHDAFLLETGQLSAILRDAHGGRPRAVPTPEQRAMRTVRLGILGAGRVTHLFLRLLAERGAQIQSDHGLEFSVVGIADIDPAKRMDDDLAHVPLSHDPAALVRRDDVDVVVEATRGGDTAALLETALSRRRPVVTVNKVLLHRHGPHLEALALAHGVRLAWHNAVAAGWPLIYALDRPLVREQFQSLQAVLSATCNFVLERMERGYSFASALAQAKAEDLTEQDPNLDVSGWDTAQRLLILCAKTLGLRFSVDQVEVRGMGNLDPVLVREAPRLGLRVKMVALCRRAGGGVVVGAGPMAVAADGHLGSVRGSNNVVVLAGEETGELVQLGQGSGKLPVATALLNDLIGLYHVGLSWTARYPAAGVTPMPPRFSTWLVRAQGATVLDDEPGDAGIPLLDSLVLP